MGVVAFNGIPCEEKPLEEWTHWVCSHLKSITKAPGSSEALAVTRILLGRNRSSEVFVFVHGPLPDLSDRAVYVPELAQDGPRISCNRCWCALYPASAL